MNVIKFCNQRYITSNLRAIASADVSFLINISVIAFAMTYACANTSDKLSGTTKYPCQQGKIYQSFYLKTDNVEGQVENAETETEVRKRK